MQIACLFPACDAVGGNASRTEPQCHRSYSANDSPVPGLGRGLQAGDLSSRCTNAIKLPMPHPSAARVGINCRPQYGSGISFDVGDRRRTASRNRVAGDTIAEDVHGSPTERPRTGESSISGRRISATTRRPCSMRGWPHTTPRPRSRRALPRFFLPAMRRPSRMSRAR